MMHVLEDLYFEREFLLAGHRAQAGNYRELGSGRIVRLEQEDVLPASLDGRVACYIRIASTWGQIVSAHAEEAQKAGD